MKIDIEGVESALSLCIKALKILHPVMDKDEPCIAHEAYESARWALRHLASQQTVQADALGHADGCAWNHHEVVNGKSYCKRCKHRLT